MRLCVCVALPECLGVFAHAHEPAQVVKLGPGPYQEQEVWRKGDLTIQYSRYWVRDAIVVGEGSEGEVPSEAITTRTQRMHSSYNANPMSRRTRFFTVTKT